MARSSNGQSAISRAVHVLESFDPTSNELTLTQIAARTGMPMATVHGIVGELVSLGLLERRGRELILGVRLWELAVRAPGVVGLREIALPHLELVRNRLEQHAQLGILQGGEVLYLERLSAPESVVNWTMVGGRIPWYATSSGIVLAADAPAGKQEEMLGSPRPRFSVEPQMSTADLRRLLAKVRREGHAVTLGYIHPDATAVAVPIKGPYGHAVASLSVVVPTEGFRAAPVLEVLAPAAHAVSAELKQTYLG
ncbi:IclR family transcriptional regulator [Arthrobacter crystallopoietes BAB-32]|uniref:IclR family transcriptional regulator n=1 Tax=Arthrobacter crystallopoietes BAB-32 TaxID=1246476 RepID=N1UVL5_9MICC|nr:IclR family transcriptional regulator [Arthrobacter crystallopoietes]EMY34451.1 IclR family transcriptional regulator [Arthrobacter crystallopoietes BAB-32]